MRKHYKKWNVIQLEYYTVVLLHLAASHRQAVLQYHDS